MDNILNKVNNPEDLRKLNIKEKEQLAKEIREKIIKYSISNRRTLSIKFRCYRTYYCTS